MKAALVSSAQVQSLITLICNEGNVRLLGKCLLSQHYCYMISTFLPGFMAVDHQIVPIKDLLLFIEMRLV